VKRHRLLLFFILGLLAPFWADAQAVVDTSLNQVLPDTLPARTAPVLEEPAPDQQAYDSLNGVVAPFQPNPKKSALYSCILPGAGQIYNRQYWKAPIIYAGMAASFYFLIFNNTEYQRFRRGYIARIANANVVDEFTLSGRSANDLRTLQDSYKQQLDLTYLLTGLGYTIQVLDALAFAHLKNFDVSKNISLRMKPVMLQTGQPALGLVMNF
jgi:hypothetical protein